MTITMPYQDKPLSYRLSKLAVHAQFVWWLGHLAVVLSTPLYILSLMVDKQNASRFYYRVFRGSMLSYGIVVWKGHKPLDISYSSLLKMLNDETTAYLSLACSWFFASPCLGKLDSNTFFNATSVDIPFLRLFDIPLYKLHSARGFSRLFPPVPPKRSRFTMQQ
ncbi:Transmembrane nucleoporin [Entomophthora muscae]|uniref:Transmembrane nucleoporin n=1 Tax=Entomophthora muscae TaxID=34485 RepID=A0ACC2T4V8_9FUNG|nr:Transmembrane nucleoporin [Entomophthora muscae]